MSLLAFLLISSVTWAILHVLWIPALERSVETDRSIATIGRYGLLAALGAVRGMLLVTSLSTAFVLLAVAVLQWGQGSTVAEAKAAIDRVQGWRDFLVSVRNTWALAAVGLLCLAVVLYSYRRGQVKAKQAFQQLYDAEHQDLTERHDRQALDPQPPTAEMQEMQRSMDQVEAELHRLRAEGPENSSAIQELTKLQHLGASHIKELDIHRRMDLRLGRDAALPKPRGFFGRLQVFFMSRGLLASLNLGSRLLYGTTLVLLVPSLIGVHSGTVATNLDSRINELSDYRIELQQQYLADQVVALGDEQAELSAEDEQLVNDIAIAYERSLAPAVPALASRSYGIRSAVVRAEITSRAAARRPESVKAVPTGSDAPRLNDLERSSIELFELAKGQSTPVTEAGRSLRESLRSVLQRSPSHLANVRASFQQPATSVDLSRAVLTNMTDFVASNELGELGDIVSETRIQALDPDRIRAARFDQTNSIMLQLIDTGGDVESAFSPQRTLSPELEDLQSVVRSSIENLPLENASASLGDSPPALRELPEPHIDLDDAIAELEDFNQLTGPRADFADAAASFDDWFPGQLGADAETPRGQLLDRLDLGDLDGPSGASGGGRGGGGRAAFSRARSFSGLRGFSRVGGVLMGNSASDAHEGVLDYTDLQWKIDNDQIEFVLVERGGDEVRSMLHRLPVAYDALTYASDGRPLAVTMVTASPLPDLKILLNPALVDTPMGHRVIELDRFVDTFVDDERRREATNLVYAHQSLYEIAWAQRLLGAVGEGLLLGSEDAAYLTDLVVNEARREQAALALGDPSAILNSQRSPLAAKPAFFDPEIVAMMSAGAVDSSSLIAFEEYAARHGAAQFASVRNSSEIEDWFLPVPDFQVWSGVRERSFSLVEAQHVAKSHEEYDKIFEFVLQVAFTSAPQFGSADDATLAYVDEDPWEFPALADHIHAATEAAARNDTRANTILEDTAEFAQLQRLFRLAFDGELGPDFPVERLGHLAAALDANAEPVHWRTARWNASPELLATYQEAYGAEFGTEAADALGAIRNALGLAKDEERQLNYELPPFD